MQVYHNIIAILIIIYRTFPLVLYILHQNCFEIKYGQSAYYISKKVLHSIQYGCLQFEPYPN